MGLLKDLFHIRKAVAEKNTLHEQLTQQVKQVEETLASLRAETEAAQEIKDTALKNRDAEVDKTKAECEKIISDFSENTATAKQTYEAAKEELDSRMQLLEEQQQKLDIGETRIKLYRDTLRKLLKVIKNDGIDAISVYDIEGFNVIDEFAPSVILNIHTFDVKSLKQLSTDNDKLIDATLEKYESRYTTKTNRALYQLMVLALRAELQNILISLKFSSLEKSQEALKSMIKKYLKIASDGNQQIAPTLYMFIAEMEILFDNALSIEYEYYIKKEQERLEQQEIREQIRQETAERKQLEQQRKQVEKEEEKYILEINSIKEQIAESLDDSKIEKLQSRILLLEELLSKVNEKKEEIINLQNGKAGYVYVISNLGSFGENRFKIGMTRRLDPTERVRELGDASVPFAFDVHSFIFSDDVVSLEGELHKRLEKERVNKVNRRKEFFDVSIDELENIVQEIDSTAEFTRTMIATEYRKTLSILKLEKNAA